MADDVPLAEVRVVGPFDFQQKRMGLQKGPKKLAKSETNHIAELYWQALEKEAHRFNLPIDDIRTLPRDNARMYHPTATS